MSSAAGGGGVAVAPMTWQDELASLVGDHGIRYSAAAEDGNGNGNRNVVGDGRFHGGVAAAAEESFKEQLKGFLAASGELMVELGRGCRDIALQSLVGVEDHYVVRKLKGPCAGASVRLRFLNDYLPEDRDPAHSWLVIAFVSLIALAALNVNTGNQTSLELPKKLYIHPPSAARIQLPDGRYMAYAEQGVPAESARFSLVAPHTFLSSRLSGIPGINRSLLEEFGVRLVTYDLPGFGESDPHPSRNLNSSALDMMNLADAVGVKDKFWVVGYSGGGMHAWAAIRYIPDKLAGAVMFAPISNPYESGMTKEERYKTWEKWTARKKLMYMLARRFPTLLPYFYRRSFLSGKDDRPEKWLSLSLGKKDKILVEDPAFSEFWKRDVAESVRQGMIKPFVEEAVLQVSNWGFSLGEVQVHKKRGGNSLVSWLKSIYSPPEREWAGFLGPIHIWQGVDDRVVPPSMSEYVRRVVPGATVHKLLGEGHFSYFCFCDECHRQVFSTLFGTPQGPLSSSEDDDRSSSEESCEETTLQNCTQQE